MVMAQRRFHYDAAFEHYLRVNAIPYVAVDEAKRALSASRSGDARPAWGADKLKSFDFVVYSEHGPNLLVDVKGRKHARGSGRGLQNWVTRDDVEHLLQWQRLFGDGFVAALAFLFWCETQPPDALFAEIFEYNGRWYVVQGVLVSDYRQHMRPRSAVWDTVSVSAEAFARMAQPLKQLL